MYQGLPGALYQSESCSAGPAQALTRMCACLQSFWAISRDKRGYSGMACLWSQAWVQLAIIMHEHESWLLSGFYASWSLTAGHAGVVTYVLDSWSPIQAEADSLGSGDSDIDKEGR